MRSAHPLHRLGHLRAMRLYPRHLTRISFGQQLDTSVSSSSIRARSVMLGQRTRSSRRFSSGKHSHRALGVHFERSPAAAVGSQLQSIEQERHQHDDDEGGKGQAERGDELIEEAQPVTCGASESKGPQQRRWSDLLIVLLSEPATLPYHFPVRLALRSPAMGSRCGHVPTMHSAGTTAKASMRT